jgi:hypothetical protein
MVGFAASSRTLRQALLFIYKLVGKHLKTLEISEKITITIILILSYLFLKYTFPIMIDIFKSMFRSVNPKFTDKIPWYFNIVQRLPDILGFGLLIVILLLWTNYMN